MPTILGYSRRTLNSALNLAGLELKRADHDWDDPKTFLPFASTLSDAGAAGLSVADFVDARYNRPGATQECIDRLAELGAFGHDIRTVCEIGPGSGRYLEKVIKICNPERYEIYETATRWASWLVDTYGVIRQPTDGKTLSATRTHSIDLVQAHKVFVATPSIVTCRYLDEMARVVRDGGRVVFDVMTEECLDEATLGSWFTTGIQSGPYPAIMPKQFVTSLLHGRGLSLVGSFFVPMEPGRTECFVFAR